MTPLEREAQRRAEWITGLHALAEALAADESLPTPSSSFISSCVWGRYDENGRYPEMSTAEKFAALRETATRYAAEVTEDDDGRRRVTLKFGLVELCLHASPGTPVTPRTRVVPVAEDAVLIGGGL